MSNYFGARGNIDTGNGQAVIYRLSKLADEGIGHIDRLPFSIKVLLENALRNQDGHHFTRDDVKNLASWDALNHNPVEDPLRSRACNSAGLHGRSFPRRSGGFAQRHGAHGGRSAKDQSDGAC